MGSGFRFQAYATLRKHLGEYDAIVEINELAVRSFLHRIQESPDTLQKESTKHSIRVNLSDRVTEHQFAARRAHFYILSVYQQAEVFFDELLNDLPQGMNWKTKPNTARRTDESQLEWIVRIVTQVEEIQLPEYFDDYVSVFDYFRLVRNAFMHEGTETRQLKNLVAKLMKRSRELLESSSTSPDILKLVPNTYSNLNFDDFVMFTRIVKEIALLLCNALKPDLDSLIRNIFSSKQNHGLKKYIGNEKRFAVACETFLVRRYNLDLAEVNYAIPIIKSLI